MNRAVELNEQKAILKTLLKKVDDICREQGLRYSMGGGTLLGAVRHKGFIPWDDDIDIMMPRPDYDAFIDYCLTHDVPFGIKSWETDRNYVDFSAKVFDTDTIIECDIDVQNGGGMGVSLDIFPIDGLGDTLKKAKKIYRSTRFKRELLNAAQWKKFFRSRTHAWYYEPIRFAMFVLSRFVNKQKLFEKVLKKHTRVDFETSNFAGAVGGSYREKEILPKEVFTDYIELPFEEYSFKAIAAYDAYLSSIYGDYMKLPPEEKQVSHHLSVAYYKEDKE